MYTSIMHVAFFTDRMEDMIAFYTVKMGGVLKTVTRFGVYLDREDRPEMQAVAKTDPDKIFNAYIEMAPLQFLELFPASDGQKEHTGFNEHKGYSHFALLTDDIYKTRKELEERGVTPFSDISIGPSGTYRMWFEDPDGNCFEIMQFTENSVQVKGNL